MKARAKKRRSGCPSCSFKRRSFRGNRSFKTLTVSHVRYSAADDNVIDDNSVTSPPASSSRRKLECSCDIENELPNGEPLSFLLINSDIVTGWLLPRV